MREQSTCPGPDPDRTPPVDARAVVRENILLNPGFGRMRLETPELAGAFAPGQFFQLSVRPRRSAAVAVAPYGSALGAGPMLRRPFAPSELLDDGFAFVYAVVGPGTAALTQCAPGDELRVLAPLGRGYDFPKTPGAPALLVGGGCGAPSLAPWAQALVRAGHPARAVTGASCRSALLGFDELARHCPTVAASDDGSVGRPGNALDAAKELAEEFVPLSTDAAVAAGGAVATVPAVPTVYACGPRGLLAAVAAWAAGRGWPCRVSLEERMACGFGACMGCAVAVRDPAAPDGRRYERVCREGPVFDAERIVW